MSNRALAWIQWIFVFIGFAAVGSIGFTALQYPDLTQSELFTIHAPHIALALLSVAIAGGVFYRRHSA